MTRPRNLLEEIQAKRRRLGRQPIRFRLSNDRLLAVFEAIDQLRRMPSSRRRAKAELLRSVPISLVAVLEGYFRALIANLIDSSHIYRENAARLDQVRFEPTVVLRMKDARISAGDLIAHTLPLSSMSDIQRHMSTLMECDFMLAVRDAQGPVSTPLRQIDPQFYDTLAGAFSDRHVFCHELNPKHKQTFHRALKQWRSTILFLTATENALYECAPRRPVGIG